jgi:broad specificity phosphatase PhoE
MDVDGQAAMARVLRAIRAETTIVVAHGLSSDALYGDFEAVDVVEKVGDTSRVRLGIGESQS